MPDKESYSSSPLERKQLPGIAADSPPLWNQWHEPLMDVVCALYILFQKDMENEKQFRGEELLKD
jgi:hypothetical protein